MELIHFTYQWVDYELLQAKIMMAIGSTLLLVIIFLFNSQNAVIKGFIIPSFLIVLVCLGYGMWKHYRLPTILKDVVNEYKVAPKKTIYKEYTRIAIEISSYPKYKLTWVVLGLISMLIVGISISAYIKGIALGFLFLSMTFITFDLILENNAKNYLRNIERIIKKDNFVL